MNAEQNVGPKPPTLRFEMEALLAGARSTWAFVLTERWTSEMKLLATILVVTAIAFPSTSVAQDAIATKLIEKLEKESASLSEENSKLIERVAELASENETLKNQIAELEEKLAKPKGKSKGRDADEKIDLSKLGTQWTGTRFNNGGKFECDGELVDRTSDSITFETRGISSNNKIKWKLSVVGSKVTLKEVAHESSNVATSVVRGEGRLTEKSLRFTYYTKDFVNGKMTGQGVGEFVMLLKK
jgi:cell division protein FtsB